MYDGLYTLGGTIHQGHVHEAMGYTPGCGGGGIVLVQRRCENKVMGNTHPEYSTLRLCTSMME